MNKTTTILLFAAAASACLAAAEVPAPDDSGMFPSVIRPDAAGTAADMSALLDAPAGKNGFLSREGEHFVDGRGNRVRLNGVNLTARGNFPSHDEADRLARHFARLGFNCVRLHYFDTTVYKNCFQAPQPCLLKEDSEGRLVIDEVMRDRLEYLIAALKRNGIYINMNIHAGRHLKPADGIPKTPWANRGVDFFNPRLIKEEQEFARDVLRHVNPYTGLALADDPTMAILEVNNENALMQVWWSKTLEKQDADPCYTAEFHRLREAAGYSATTNGIIKFIIETEKRYFRTMIGFMRVELGVKCPCVGTQQDYTAAWVMAETCDAIDTHIYWNHPGWKNPSGTDGRVGRTPGVEWWFRNCAVVDADVRGDCDYGNPIVYRGARRVKGLPFVTSEAASPYPCWYGAEYQPMLHAYGAFQDWAGIFVYSWNNSTEAFPDFNEYFFSHSARPDCVAHFPACAAMFLRGDVSEAKRRVVVPADVDWLMDKAAYKGYVQFVYADAQRCSPNPLPDETFLLHGLSVDLDPAPGATTPSVDVAAKDGRYVSDTGELAHQPTSNSNGVFTVDAPNVKVLTGHTDGRRFDLGGVVFEPGRTKLGWSAVSLVSRDGTGIRPGSRLLLAATGYTHNGGAAFHKKDGVKWGGITEELGEGKTVTEGVPLTVTLPCAAAKCWALDEAGARKSEVPVEVRGGRAVVVVGPEFRTVWYEIYIPQS